jgi:histone-lysine N-methyltransferase SETMAR
LFLQEKALPHKAAITHQKLVDLQFPVLKQLAHSPDLAPSDYHLFSNLKTRLLKGRSCSSTEDATLAEGEWFAEQSKEFLLDGLKKLEQQSHKCVKLRWNVKSKYTFFKPVACCKI